jgi:biotin carboxylase
LKLAIIGASYLQLPLIKKAKEMGIETHVFAWEEGAVGKDYSDYFYPISIVEKERILSICRDIEIDGITSIASDLAVITVNYIANKLNLVGNSNFSTKVMTNKYLMREQLNKIGLPSPKFVLVKNSKNLKKLNNFNFPLIVKPTDRSGSRGITKINSQDKLYSAIERALAYSFSNTVIIEEFIEGKEISVETISFNGKHYHLAITDKITTGSPYFVELEHKQPSTFVNICEENIIKIVKDALNVLEFKNGASHCELIISKNNEINIVEVGGRMGGDFIGSDLVQLSIGYDFLQGVIDVSLGNFNPPNHIEYNYYSGVRFYNNNEDGIVTSITNNSFFNKDDVVKEELNIKIGDKVSSLKESSDRFGYYIYQSKNPHTQKEFPYIIKLNKKGKK